ncbi:L-type lectin family protein [Myroides sp. LJL116]
MNKLYYIIILCFSSLLLLGQSPSGVVYESSLISEDGTRPAGIIEDMGTFAPSGAQRYTKDGLILTHKNLGVSGFAIDDLVIDLNSKVSFEFDYALASVENPVNGSTKGGGLVFFLYDATQPKLTIGANRAALGYATNANVSGQMKKALQGGYLGIGFSYYFDRSPGVGRGFYGTGAMKNYELREGIQEDQFQKVSSNPGISKYNDFVYNRGQITLRGGTTNTNYNNLGTPVLFTRYFGGEQAPEDYFTMATIDGSNGSYTFAHNPNGHLMDILDGGKEGAYNFQRIKVDVAPIFGDDGTSLVGTTISISTIKDGKTIPLVEDFEYLDHYRVKNIYNAEYGFSHPVPQKVKFGFTASTGDFLEQIAIVRNLKVTSSDFLVVPPSSWQMCVKKSDNADNNNIGGISSAILFKDSDLDLNKQSFSFLNTKGEKVGLTLNQTDVGKWTYNPETSEVTFTVTGKYVTSSQNMRAKYVIDNNNGKTSEEIVLTINTVECGAIVNPNIESRVLKK